MEEQIQPLHRGRKPAERQRNLLQMMAQPREVLIMRATILITLVIAFSLSVSSKNQSTDDPGIIFWDITSYRYCFVTIIIGIAYNIVALLLNLLQYYVPEIRAKILSEFEFLCDKVITSLLATGAAAGLGASVDLQKASAYSGAGTILNTGKAVSSFLVGAFFLAFVLSLCSSRALEERGLCSKNLCVNQQRNDMTPLPIVSR